MMQLSVEQFEQILATLKSDGGTRQKERRQGPRVGLRCSIHIIPIIDGIAKKGVNVSLRDISREGIGIAITDSLRMGTQFIVKFPQTDSETETFLVCTVSNRRPLNEGTFAIGARFVKTMRTPPKPGAKIAPVQDDAKVQADKQLEQIRKAVLD